MKAPTYTSFILHRLHSLTGVVPLGAFLLEHFFTNSFSHSGAAVYNGKVEFLRTLPFVLVLEWGGIFLPLLFHTILGIYYTYTGQFNVSGLPYARNWMYVLQRVSAFFALFFILYHVLTLRFGVGGRVDFSAGHPDFFSIMSATFNDPVLTAFYILGIAATCFHFANGLSTFVMTWGLIIGRTGQRIWGYACVAIGFGLAAMAYWSMLGFDGESAPAARHAGAPRITIVAEQPADKI